MTRPVVEGGPAVVCLGETMAQIVPIDGLRLHEASACAFGVAGAESNVAISLSRLGTAAFWAGFVGDDPMGLRVLGELRRHGVVTKLARTMPGRRTGVYFKDPAPEGSDIYYYRSGSAATLMDGEYAERIAAVRPRWIHLTGVTPALSENCREAVISLIELAGDTGASVSFDVNYRPSLWPARDAAAQSLMAIADRCNVVFVGLDEAQTLWKSCTAGAVRDHLPSPDVVVVKDGGREAVAFRGGRRTAVPALPVDVVEPVGAGDAFAAGWIHGALVGLDDAGCLRLGHLLAGAAMTSLSDVADLPTAPAALVARAKHGNEWPGHGSPAEASPHL
ncbi:sugar kinase [Streptomyces sp. NPDC048002]|uniref:sugar kinase n=1 Tax=Streptomyces sp. NPDC048002 TaxID=3154344 RepID=UPI0033EDDB13